MRKSLALLMVLWMPLAAWAADQGQHKQCDKGGISASATIPATPFNSHPAGNSTANNTTGTPVQGGFVR
ncbi:MAG: hypothetical protein ACM3OC_08620 [Deltaproteobacteria bacterium]